MPTVGSRCGRVLVERGLVTPEAVGVLTSGGSWGLGFDAEGLVTPGVVDRSTGNRGWSAPSWTEETFDADTVGLSTTGPHRWTREQAPAAGSA